MFTLLLGQADTHLEIFVLPLIFEVLFGCVCPESGHIHNCTYSEGEVALHEEHIRTYMFYMAGRAPRRGFDQSFSYMDAY